MEAADTAVYRLDAPANIPLRILFRAETKGLVAELIDERPGADSVYERLKGSVHDVILPHVVSDWFELTARESFHLRVLNSQQDSGGRYSLLLYNVQAEPESASAHVAIGDTVTGEAIDVPGDLDEFFFAGEAGEEVMVFLQAAGDVAGHGLRLRVTDPATGELLGETISIRTDQRLEGQSTERIVLPRTDTYTISVGGAPSGTDRNGHSSSGAYRFFIYPVKRQPESLAASVELGEVITGEAIDEVGDVDEFTFAGVEGQELSFFFRRLHYDGFQLQLTVLAPDGRVLASRTSLLPDLSLEDNGTRRIILPETGEYIVRIESSRVGGFAVTSGAYEFEIYPIDRAPESLSRRVALGDTIAGERLDRLGDLDEFTFAGAAGQYVNFFIYSLEPDTATSFFLEFALPDMYYRIRTEPRPRSVPVSWTGRIQLPRTGDYTFCVGAGSEAGLDRGEYMVELFHIDPGPEVLSALVAIGDTVLGEAIDRVGDIDRFTFFGEEGREFNLFAWAEPEANGPFYFKIFTPSGFSFPYGWEVSSDEPSTGPIRIPTTGYYTVEVSSLAPVDSDSIVGPYGFYLAPLNPAP